MNDKAKTIDNIEAILPQTQCRLCTYDGCKPYAQAIVNDGQAIDLCQPGGIRVLDKIGKITGTDTQPMHADMLKKSKPPMLAVIRESECIGCTKCIKACPVDAIIGGPKLMHTVITDACNGCELCVAPCPVDCIDMIELPEKTEEAHQLLATQSKARFDRHNQVLEREAMQKKEKHLQAKNAGLKTETKAARQAAIAAALLRAKERKNKS